MGLGLAHARPLKIEAAHRPQITMRWGGARSGLAGNELIACLHVVFSHRCSKGGREAEGRRMDEEEGARGGLGRPRRL